MRADVLVQITARYSLTAALGKADPRPFDHVWRWRVKLPERYGQLCRVTARGRMNSVRVEFPDGFFVITSAWAVKKA